MVRNLLIVKLKFIYLYTNVKMVNNYKLIKEILINKNLDIYLTNYIIDLVAFNEYIKDFNLVQLQLINQPPLFKTNIKYNKSKSSIVDNNYAKFRLKLLLGWK